MPRYAFEIQYNGTDYFGWQRQPKQISIQEKIEQTLTQLFNSEHIPIVGCGRTDTGVHAHQAYFHVDLPDLFTTEELHFKVNRMTPQAIAVKSVVRVSDGFHARFDASQRSYRYFIHQQKNPFNTHLSLYFPKMLDLDKMNDACQYLLGKQDFTSFSKLHTDVKTNICTVTKALWTKTSENELFFEISADRFLRNMVRSIVGTLLEVGQGNMEAQEIKQIIAKMDRGEAKMSVAAHGLYLWQITYPELS